MGNVTQTADALGGVTNRSYDGRGNTLSEQDPLGRTRSYTYDGQERLVQVDEQVRLNDDGTRSATLNTWSTKYTYRADGLLTEITDSQGNIRHYIYDGMGRLISQNDPDIGITNNVYDDADNIIQAEDGKSAGTV